MTNDSRLTTNVMEAKYMQLALEEAYTGIKAGDGGPFGAVIVKDGEVAGKGHNTVLIDNDPTHHAEINVISMASKKLNSHDLSECVIYSTNEPCPMCFSAIHWAKIDCVIYGTTIEDVRALGFNELTLKAHEMKRIGKSPVEIYPGVCRDECVKLLEFWKTLPGTKVY